MLRAALALAAVAGAKDAASPQPSPEEKHGKPRTKHGKPYP